MRCAVGFLLLGTVAAPLAAQDSVRVVPDSITCGECSLQVTAIVEVGDRDGPGILGEQAHVTRADDGDYYAFSFMQMGRLLGSLPRASFRRQSGAPARGRESTLRRHSCGAQRTL